MSEQELLENPQTPEIDPGLALERLASAAKMARLTYDEHALCEKSFDVLAKYIGYKPTDPQVK